MEERTTDANMTSLSKHVYPPQIAKYPTALKLLFLLRYAPALLSRQATPTYTALPRQDVSRILRILRCQSISNLHRRIPDSVIPYIEPCECFIMVSPPRDSAVGLPCRSGADAEASPPPSNSNLVTSSVHGRLCNDRQRRLEI